MKYTYGALLLTMQESTYSSNDVNCLSLSHRVVVIISCYTRLTRSVYALLVNASCIIIFP